MINLWWFSRPQRKVKRIPSIIACGISSIIGIGWKGKRETHILMEELLEKNGIKRPGERRDHSGSGGRTYMAWLRSYGFVFEHNDRLEYTLAAEDIMNGESPVSVMRQQVIKYQFPSAFTYSGRSEVSRRFKIHPYVFLLKLLSDPVLEGYVTEDEIAFIIIEEAENESDSCYRKVVNHILDFRNRGDKAIPSVEELDRLYRSEQVGKLGYYKDIANTMVNVFEYTQLIVRTDNEEGNSCVRIADEEVETVREILAKPPTFIDRPEDQSYFQRKYGVGITHRKDTRNLATADAKSMKLIKESNIRNSFIKLSLQRPIYSIDDTVIEEMVRDLNSLYTFSEIEDVVRRCYPGGAPSGFYSNYYQMAFDGREQCTEFEKATETVFRDVFGFQTEHIGQKGKVPDVVISTDSEGYQAIIDAKAYSKYTLSNDHLNRMVHSYIPTIYQYSFSKQPLAAFCYIAGGFGNTMPNWLKNVMDTTGTPGSAFTVRTIISMAEAQKANPISHATWKTLLASGKVYTPDQLHLKG